MKKVALILSFLLLVGIALSFLVSKQNNAQPKVESANTLNANESVDILDSDTILTPRLEVNTAQGTTTLSILLAKTDAEQEKGLGDRSALPKNVGMLFVFPYQDFHRIWMKDMHFSLDILWLDSNFKVIGLYTNVSPDTYPKVFSIQEKDLYVLEVNAGFVARTGLKVGDIFVPHDLY